MFQEPHQQRFSKLTFYTLYKAKLIPSKLQSIYLTTIKRLAGLPGNTCSYSSNDLSSWDFPNRMHEFCAALPNTSLLTHLSVFMKHRTTWYKVKQWMTNLIKTGKDLLNNITCTAVVTRTAKMIQLPKALLEREFLSHATSSSDNQSSLH